MPVDLDMRARCVASERATDLKLGRKERSPISYPHQSPSSLALQISPAQSLVR